ncbi:hypothetical protein EON81_08235 [bacterium]|nr:MAG: hypothetical protein EON81_08235 [bacterium]
MKRTLLLAFSAVAAIASAQNTPLFWNQASGSGIATDRTVDTAVDASNNAYQLSRTSVGVNSNITLTKYDTVGALVWTRTYDFSNGDMPTALALDADGDPVLVGSYTDATTATQTNGLCVKASKLNGDIIFAQAYAPGVTTGKFIIHDVAVAADDSLAFSTSSDAIPTGGTVASARPIVYHYAADGATFIAGLNFGSATTVGAFTKVQIKGDRIYYGGSLTAPSAAILGWVRLSLVGSPTAADYGAFTAGGAAVPYEKLNAMVVTNDDRIIWYGTATDDAAGLVNPRETFGQIKTAATAANSRYTATTIDGVVGTGLAYDTVTGQIAFQYSVPVAGVITSGTFFATVDTAANWFTYGSDYTTSAGYGGGIVSKGGNQFVSIVNNGGTLLSSIVTPALGEVSRTTVGLSTGNYLANGISTAPSYSTIGGFGRAITIGGGSATGANIFGLSLLAGPADEKRIKEDTSVTFNVLTNDANKSGAVFGTKTAVAFSGATAHGTVVILADGTATYTPAADFAGTDTFTYSLQVNGVTVGTPITATITVLPVNDGPTAVDDNLGTITYSGFTTVSPLTNDTDPESPSTDLKVASVSGAVNCEVRIAPDRKRVYVKPLAVGAFSFQYVAADPSGAKSNSATVSGTYLP